MDKLYYRPLGNSVFVPWDQLDFSANLWAKSYFGPHVSGSFEREETDCYLQVSGMKPEDFTKFEQLFKAHDKDGDYEAAYEFVADPVSASTLPGCVTRGVMSHFAVALGLQQWGTNIATYNGVFIMEENNDYNLLISVPAPDLSASSLDSKIADAQTRQGISDKAFQDKDGPQI